MDNEETKITELVNILHSAWFCRDEYKVREALVNVNIAVRAWKPKKEGTK